jgi:hypothetical protein
MASVANNPFMLNVVMMSVNMLIVVAPTKIPLTLRKDKTLQATAKVRKNFFSLSRLTIVAK